MDTHYPRLRRCRRGFLCGDYVGDGVARSRFTAAGAGAEAKPVIRGFVHLQFPAAEERDRATSGYVRGSYLALIPTLLPAEKMLGEGPLRKGCPL